MTDILTTTEKLKIPSEEYDKFVKEEEKKEPATKRITNASAHVTRDRKGNVILVEYKQ